MNAGENNITHPLHPDNKHLAIQLLLPDDIFDGMRLKTIAGWNQTVEDWKLYLAINPYGCFKAVLDGNIVGTVTTISYESKFSWIGMLLVDPDFRRRGIANKLMRHAVDHLKGSDTIKLDATPAGRTVYNKLGFKDEFTIDRMTTDSPTAGEPSMQGISSITEYDLSEISTIDNTVFGADRMSLISALGSMYPQSGAKIIRNGKICGYCFGRPGTKYYQIGPVIAQSTNDAIGLASTALRNLNERSVVMDVPFGQSDFQKWLISIGFSKERSLTRMFCGTNENPGRTSDIYAITGPELG